MAIEKSKRKALELITDFIDKATRLLAEKAGLDAAASKEIATDLADSLRADWGGQLIYFPKGISIDVSKQHLEMYNEWDGTPDHLAQLAQQYNISVQWAYKVVKSVRASEVARRQHNLFSD